MIRNYKPRNDFSRNRARIWNQHSKIRIPKLRSHFGSSHLTQKYVFISNVEEEEDEEDEDDEEEEK